MLREFQKLRPELRFFGCGGDRLAQQGCDIRFHIKDIAFLGFVEVLKHLPFIRRMMRSLLHECLERRPQAVVLVDYPGFNLRFARKMRKTPQLAQIPLLYYISPQVWAWHASRIPQIARLVDRMAVIFDFELPLYQAAGLHTDFVGHPLLEVVQTAISAADFRAKLNLSPDDSLLALLPGSRRQEVGRLFPLFLNTFRRLRKNFPKLRAVVACAPDLDQSLYRSIMAAHKFEESDILLLRGLTYDILAHSDVALVASGTATLETAILGTPLVMAYRVSPLTYLLGRFLVKIPNLALVNVVAGKRIIPEFVQNRANPASLAAELTSLLKDSVRRQEMAAELAQVKAKLGAPGASRKVAAILNEMISPKSASV